MTRIQSRALAVDAVIGVSLPDSCGAPTELEKCTPTSPLRPRLTTRSAMSPLNLIATPNTVPPLDVTPSNGRQANGTLSASVSVLTTLASRTVNSKSSSRARVSSMLVVWSFVIAMLVASVV